MGVHFSFTHPDIRLMPYVMARGLVTPRPLASLVTVRVPRQLSLREALRWAGNLMLALPSITISLVWLHDLLMAFFSFVTC